MKSRVLGTLLALGLAAALTPAAAFADVGASDAIEPFAPTGVVSGGIVGDEATGSDVATTTVATIYDPATKKTTQFTSLKDAVDVADGKTIVLQKDCSEGVEVTKSVHFAIELNKYKFTGDITAPVEFSITRTVSKNKNVIDYKITAPIANDEDDEPITPVAGEDAPETAVEISKTAFPDGADWAIIACNTGFEDAMSATGLAGTLDCPILTTDIHKTSPEVLEEVQRLGAKNVYIIGGKVALPADVEGDLAAIGVTGARVYGPNSWDTSVACNTKIVEHGGNPDGAAIISTSINFQDALSMSSFAFKYKVPIFLTTNTLALSTAARSAITNLPGTVYVAGGHLAVPSMIAESAFGNRVVRLAGNDGYDTSNEIATFMVDNGLLGNEVACVASGAFISKGLDALSGSVLAGKRDAPVLLVNGLVFDKKDKNYEPVNTVVIHGDDSEGTEAFITHNAASLKKVYILGGPMAVPTGVKNDIAKIIAPTA